MTAMTREQEEEGELEREWEAGPVQD